MLAAADHPDAGIFFFNDHNPITLHQLNVTCAPAAPCKLEACNRAFD